MGSACFATGNQENLEFIKEYIDTNNLGAKVSIIGALCENKCDQGPRIFINDTEYKKVTQEQIAELLKQLK